MQRNTKIVDDDLDYLAQQGFEKVNTTEGDLDELVKQVRSRSFSYNSGLYFGFIGLMAGVFIGLSLFFALSRGTADVLPAETADVQAIAGKVVEAPAPVIQLDTVVINENFVNPHPKTPAAKPTGVAEAAEPQTNTEPVASIPEKPVDAALFHNGTVEEAKLKFIANAPVVYIHDLKVTDYTRLYFRNSRFLRLNERPGVSADKANRSEVMNATSRLKQQADYYLHEELASALLDFKKGEYSRCLVALKEIAAYNDNDINCDFYRGMCYYYRHNYEKALPLFENCITALNNTFFQEAMFYKAMSERESGNTAAAQTLFKQIAEEDGFYAAKAAGMLKGESGRVPE